MRVRTPCAWPLWFRTEQRRVLLASAGLCGEPWSPAVSHSRVTAFTLRACMAWVPGNSKPRRAVRLHLTHPGGHFRSLGRNVARAPTGAPGSRDHLSAVPQRLPVRSRWFFKPCSVAASQPGSEPVFRLQRRASPSAWPPCKRPRQPVIETLSRSLVCSWPGAVCRGAGCPPLPHPALGSPRQTQTLLPCGARVLLSRRQTFT